MNLIITEVSVSLKLLKDPKTPVNDAIPFMVDTRNSKTIERVLPRRDSDAQVYESNDVPDWITRPKANCLRFTLAKDEENEIFQDVECTYNVITGLTFHGIKYNNIQDYGSKYITKILKILDTTALDNSKTTRYKATAKIYISLPFDKDLLADIIMNDYRLSNKMALCEKTSTLGDRRLFSVAVSLDEYDSSYARVALAEKYVNDDDKTEIIAMISKLPNEELSEYVENTIKHAFELYEIAYSDINHEKYVEDNEGSYASSIAEGIKQLRKELPELFVNNYTRECPILPVMVSEEETHLLRSKGIRVILYPYPNDPKYSRYYTAQPETGYYVGLKRNRLSNRNLFPCLVTCYLLDHMKRVGSETYKYYNKSDADVQLLQKDKLRPVPKSIALLYSNNPLDTSYHRKKAVSFISALEQSTGTTIKVFDWCPQVTKQEMWDKSDTEIMNIIMNNSCYGHGSSVYRYFEEMLKVSIHVVVIRDGKFEPLIPRHKQVYIWDAPYTEHVVIFETFKTTYGNTSCSYEYLVRVSRPSSANGNKRNVEHHKFYSEDSMIRSILFQKSSESTKIGHYSDTLSKNADTKCNLTQLSKNADTKCPSESQVCEISESVFSPGRIVNSYEGAKEQLIDNWGKCREITMYDGSKIQTFTRPLTVPVTPDPTCFFDSHIRKMNKIKFEMNVELIDLSKRSTTKIIYFPNDESFWYWM